MMDKYWILFDWCGQCARFGHKEAHTMAEATSEHTSSAISRTAIASMCIQMMMLPFGLVRVNLHNQCGPDNARLITVIYWQILMHFCDCFEQGAKLTFHTMLLWAGRASFSVARIVPSFVCGPHARNSWCICVRRSLCGFTVECQQLRCGAIGVPRRMR